MENQQKNDHFKPFSRVFLVFLMVCIIQLSMISALDFDNVQRISIDNKEITIKNMWGLGADLAKYRLEEHTKVCLIDCWAKGTATLYEKGRIFNYFEFKDTKNNYHANNYKVYISEYKQVTEQEPYTVEECYINSNETETCENEVYYRDKLVNKWIERQYNGEILNPNTYRWRLVAKKDKDINLDFIPNAYGEKLSSWAWWNSTFQKKQKITITENSSEDYNNFELELNISYDNNMKTNFGDLRFLNNSENTEYSYYIDKYVSGEWALVYVKIPYLPASGTIYLYMYYGNAVASTTSDETGFIQKDLQASYNFKEGAGTTVEDSKNKTEGYFVDSPSFESSKAGYGVDFDNGNESVDGIYKIPFGSFTISSWVKATFSGGGSDDNPIYVNKQPSGWGIIVFKLDESGKVCLYIRENQAEGGSGNIWCSTLTATTNKWYHIGASYNSGDNVVTAYLNGSTDTSSYTHETWDATEVRSIGKDYIAGEYSNADIDEVNVWTRVLNSTEMTYLQTEVSLYPEGYPVVSYGTEESSVEAPVVTLNEPVDSYLTSNPTQFFNCSATDNTGVLNLTWVRDGSRLFTVYNTTPNQLNLTFANSIGINEGTHTWNCLAFDEEGGNDTATNFSYELDTISPTISISSPSGFADYGEVGVSSLYLNYSIYDPNLDSCWYNYNSTNVSVNCLTNTTSFTITTKQNLTFYANDSLGHENNTLQSWIYKITNAGEVYPYDTIEGLTEDFKINVTMGDGVSLDTVRFWYNGTPATAQVSGSGIDKIISYSLSVPNVDNTVNASWNWEFLVDYFDGAIFHNDYQINITPKQLRVQGLNIDNCSNYTEVILNYSLRDEETQRFLNASALADNTSIFLDVDISPYGTTSPILEFSQYFNNTNPIAVCLSANLTATSLFRLDTTLSHYRHLGVTEFHYIQNYTLKDSTIPNEINLYNLLNTDSQEFLISFDDSNFIPVENALINIKRFYIDEGVSKSVEVIKTDADGESIGHLVLSDVIYSLVVTKNGQTLGTFNNVFAVCENAALGDCTISLNEVLSTTNPADFVNYKDVNLYHTFDKSTKTISLDFNIPSGSNSKIYLNVTKYDLIGNRSVCFDTVTSSSGTLTCNIPSSYGNVTLISEVFKDGELIQSKVFTIHPNPRIVWSVFYGVIVLALVLSLGLMFITSPIGVIIGAILGLITSTILNLISGGGVIGITGSVVWLIIAGGIIIYKITRNT